MSHRFLGGGVGGGLRGIGLCFALSLPSAPSSVTSLCFRSLLLFSLLSEDSACLREEVPRFPPCVDSGVGGPGFQSDLSHLPCMWSCLSFHNCKVELLVGPTSELL